MHGERTLSNEHPCQTRYILVTYFKTTYIITIIIIITIIFNILYQCFGQPSYRPFNKKTRHFPRLECETLTSAVGTIFLLGAN